MLVDHYIYLVLRVNNMGTFIVVGLFYVLLKLHVHRPCNLLMLVHILNSLAAISSGSLYNYSIFLFSRLIVSLLVWRSAWRTW